MIDELDPTAPVRVDRRAGWDSPHYLELEAHGVVVIVGRDGRIAAVSEGGAQLLGASPAASAGLDAARVVGLEIAALARADGRGAWTRAQLPGGAAVRARTFAAGADLTGIDLVGVEKRDRDIATVAVERVAGWNDWLAGCTSSRELFDVVVDVVRERLGFDGVWLVRGDASGGGTVLAVDAPNIPDVSQRLVVPEDLPPGQPRIGGRFQPYYVADLACTGQRMVPGSLDIDLQPSALLRPFPAYLADKAALGVRATACLPLVVDGRLWGRVIGHTSFPRTVSVGVQSELRLLSAAASARLAELIDQEDAREQMALARHTLAVVQALAAAPDERTALRGQADALLGVCDADAALLAIEGHVESIGPDAMRSSSASVLALARAELQATDRAVVASVRLPVDVGTAVGPAGFVAARLGADDTIVWLRGPSTGSESWVQHQMSDDPAAGELFVGLTAQTRAGRAVCRPWTRAQLAQVEELRLAIGEHQVLRAAQLRAANAELARSNEEYDAFAHAAAHDLRAPLRGIQANAEFLQEDLEGRLSDVEAEQLRTISRLSLRMGSLLEDLMTYAQVGQASLEQQQVSLRAAADEAIELLGLRVPDEATVDVASATFRADPGALRQILLNLVGNAVKYAGGHPHIAIDVTTLGAVRGHAAPPETVDGASDETSVLTVSDRGIGIDPTHHGRIFGLFRQLDPEQPGSGTGLAICRLISRRQGGDIWLTSALGDGTTFYVAAGATA